MPRIARIVIEDLPHHVTQRGNNRAQVFFSDSDREFYLRILKEKSLKYGLEILGYCLMTNHVHLIATPASKDSLSLGIGRTHYRYTQRINYGLNRIGHLWQNRFSSCPLGVEHYWKALRYIEQNPVRARIVDLPWEYPWSSAAAHVGEEDPTGLLDLEKWRESSRDLDWRSILLEGLDEDEMTQLRLCTKRGRPWASEKFLDKLERSLGIALRPQRVGRPRKLNGRVRYPG